MKISAVSPQLEPSDADLVVTLSSQGEADADQDARAEAAEASRSKRDDRRRHCQPCIQLFVLPLKLSALLLSALLHLAPVRSHCFHAFNPLHS